MFDTNTLNGRFKLVGTTFLICLVALTVYAHFLVQNTASESVRFIESNRDISNSLNKYQNSLQEAESYLHQYSTFLNQTQRDHVLLSIGDLQLNVKELLSLNVTSQNTELYAYVIRLKEETILLSQAMNEFLEIMQSVESRYPGMPILMQKMEPTNRKYSEAVELALQEGTFTTFNPRAIESDNYQIMQLYQEARFAWSQQISWFRVFVANRMGAFGEPEEAMQLNLANRKLFVESVILILSKLDVYSEKGMLGLQQEESLIIMQEAVEEYEGYFTEAVAIYLSKDWRADVALLRDTLLPALHRTWKAVHDIEELISQMHNLSISESQNTASILSNFTWLFTALVTLMLGVASVLFNQKIRQPVMQLVKNMGIKGSWSDELPKMKTDVVEIKELIDAYADMRGQVQHRQRRLESILDNAAEGIIIIDQYGAIESFNAAAQRLFLYDSDEIEGKPFSLLFSTDNLPDAKDFTENGLMKWCGQQTADTSYSDENNLIACRKDHSHFYISIKMSEMRLGDRLLYTAIVDDISERRAAMEHLRHLAEHDSLTGLHNRQYFLDSLSRAFELSKRDVTNNACACIYIDLDNFKYINDTFGHLEGDKLLIGIAHVLSSRVRKTDVLSRLGGDEFAIVIPDISNDQVELLADEFRTAVSGYKFAVDGKQVDTGCSVGAALYDSEMFNKENLLARADLACHMAKRAGRNQVYIFEEKDKGRIDSYYAEMGWTRRIRDALEHDGFVFQCEPVLSMDTGELYSHEMLLRMIDVDTGEYIMPHGFLSSAERFGLMPEIDYWVVSHVFEWLNEQENNADLLYFINLSGKSIGDLTLLALIKRLLVSLKLNAENIVFEITEDVAISNLDSASQFLVELKALGFKTAIDDFGVGHSSFSYLKELAVDFVKIDGAFINSVHTDEVNLALVKAINEVCHILGKKTIAEQVPNEDAYKLLKEVGLDYAQGYNIAVASDYGQGTIHFDSSKLTQESAKKA